MTTIFCDLINKTIPSTENNISIGNKLQQNFNIYVLEKALNTVGKIEKYCIEHNIPESFVDKHGLTQQTFTISNNKAYNLTVEQSKNVCDLIRNITDPYMLNKSFSREPMTLQNNPLHEKPIDITQLIFEANSKHQRKFVSIPKESLSGCIQRVLSKLINDNIARYADTEFFSTEHPSIKAIPLNRLVPLLGAVVLEALIKQVCFRKPSLNYVKVQKHKHKVIRNTSLSKENALKLKAILCKSKHIPSYLEYKEYLDFSIETKEELDLIKELVSHYALLEHEEDRAVKFDIKEHNKTTQNIIFELGEFIVLLMEAHSLITKVSLDVENKKENFVMKDIPHMMLNKL